ncbi:Chorismate mutase/prephenate dehydratase [gamma proteobacterium HdN1]|nr:Chorismate mutase/prephenate dehydratase [gamma proteobacterium HdN1]
MSEEHSGDTAKPSGEQGLKALRQQIDTLDTELLALVNQRAKLAQAVARIKTDALEKGEKPVFFRPEREAQVLRRIKERNQGPLGDESVAWLFRELMSACLALEEPMRIAYLGPEGTYTHAATLKHFGHAVHLAPQTTIDEVFREVEAGAAHYGVVPVENSTEGMVNNTLDSFMQSNVKVCGEVALRIHHHLLVGPATRTSGITRIYSHQQSLAQCRKWLDSHYPNVERIAVSSNAEAARRLRDEWHAAAIAGDMASELYGLEKLASNIEDSPHNTTRFLVVGQESVAASGDDKTSIIVSTRDKPGALYNLLTPFRRENISLTRIETRPSRDGAWAYVFFMDFDGHETDDAIVRILDDLGSEAVYLKRLGSYPKAVL